MHLRLAVLCMLATVTFPAHPQDEDFSKVEIKATKVSGNVYMLEEAFPLREAQLT